MQKMVSDSKQTNLCSKTQFPTSNQCQIMKQGHQGLHQTEQFKMMVPNSLLPT
jgi:hypothetical protein